jgi:Rrf2 family transcriptional regulator, iron-sulfur cluster assembly transcription factor
VRGPGGGYQLGAEPQAISVASVIDAVDEPVDATRCGGQGDCHEGEVCLTHHLWTDLSTRIHQFLAGITLGDLVARREIRRIAGRQDNQLSNRRLHLIQS